MIIMSIMVEDLKRMYEFGKKSDKEFMIVVCDTFDYDDYPIYTGVNDFQDLYKEYDGKNMQKIMEVYDLSIPFEKQKFGRVYNTPEKRINKRK